jgi:hypothetical protein
MQAFIFMLSRLNASQSLEGNARVAEFGFDQPLARISMILKDSSTLRFRLGSRSPIDDSYYFQKDGDPRVFLIGNMTASLMLRSRLDYWNKELLPGITTESLELLQSITLSSTEQDSRNWVVEHSGNFVFQLAEPVHLNIKTDTVFSQLILPLSTLRTGLFLGLADDPAVYGLDNPDYTLRVVHGGTTQALLFSQDGQGGFNVVREGRPGVFSIPQDRLEFLNLGYRDLVGNYLYNGSMASVDTLEFRRPATGVSYRLALFGEGAQLYGIMNGRSIPYSLVTEAITPLYEIGIVGETGSHGISSDELRQALARPAHTRIQIAKRDGTRDILEFHSISDSLSLVSINGDTAFTAYTMAAQTIEKALEGLSGS